MDSLMYRRILKYLLFILVIKFCSAYEIPDVTIQALRPRGLRASIPGAPNIGIFAFQGNVNRDIANTDVGAISRETLVSTNGRWVVEDPDVQLKLGDVISYYVFVSVNSVGYLKDKLTYTVTELEDRTSDSENGCEPTLTRVRSGKACGGQTIFEDHFETFREDAWQIEQFIPVGNPEYPFVSYQRQHSLVSISNGNLRIVPKLQKDLPGFTNETVETGSLDLFSGCTASTANECSTEAYPSILPPVASGRVTSKGFAFTYGTVHIRAKLPLGDWLYPEILLEPFLKMKYGSLFYSSGVVRIASARGNKQLNVGVTDFGNKLLYGGPIMDYRCRQYLIDEKKLTDGKMWGDDFHVYSVNWTPERIILSVDNEEWVRVEPTSSGLSGLFPASCSDLPRSLLATGTKMAPFDDHFTITLGLAAGGITEFNDDLTSGGKMKPWRNQGRKASSDFWHDMESWWPTWSNAELLVDYVKVIAL